MTETKMKQTKCRNCGKLICDTDGAQVCFQTTDNYVCEPIRDKFKMLKCSCGHFQRVDRLENIDEKAKKCYL